MYNRTGGIHLNVPYDIRQLEIHQMFRLRDIGQNRLQVNKPFRTLTGVKFSKCSDFDENCFKLFHFLLRVIKG